MGRRGSGKPVPTVKHSVKKFWGGNRGSVDQCSSTRQTLPSVATGGQCEDNSQYFEHFDSFLRSLGAISYHVAIFIGHARTVTWCISAHA